MDPLEQIKKLREEYERSLDAAESHRAAYHQAVLDLYRGGTPLREIAKQLGLSHQRVHQIVSGEPGQKRHSKKAAGVAAAALILLALVFGGLRLAQAAPFTPSVRIPQVMLLHPATALERLRNVGLNARFLVKQRPSMPPDIVYTVLGGPTRLKGSTVTMFVSAKPHHG